MREEPGDDQEFELFDGEDVDGGQAEVEAPDDDDLTDDELAAIKASQDDPGTPGPDTAEAS